MSIYHKAVHAAGSRAGNAAAKGAAIQLFPTGINPASRTGQAQLDGAGQQVPSTGSGPKRLQLTTQSHLPVSICRYIWISGPIHVAVASCVVSGDRLACFYVLHPRATYGLGCMVYDRVRKCSRETTCMAATHASRLAPVLAVDLQCNAIMYATYCPH
jgi:hypothetical protein